MATDAENNKKTEQIQKSLAALKTRLWKAQLTETKWNPYVWHSQYSRLDEGIHALEAISFVSVDDFKSVKALVKLEQFFSNAYLLNSFHFPNYKKHIDPALLTYAAIEIQLDTLAAKASELAYRGHHLAASEAKSVVFHLSDLNFWYFVKQNIAYDDYQARALQVLNESRAILEQYHRYKQILGNLILLILTVGTAFVVNKAVNGHFLFFKQTDSAKQIDVISQTITSACPLSQPA